MFNFRDSDNDENDDGENDDDEEEDDIEATGLIKTFPLPGMTVGSSGNILL